MKKRVFVEFAREERTFLMLIGVGFLLVGVVYPYPEVARWVGFLIAGLKQLNRSGTEHGVDAGVVTLFYQNHHLIDGGARCIEYDLPFPSLLSFLAFRRAVAGRGQGQAHKGSQTNLPNL